MHGEVRGSNPLSSTIYLNRWTPDPLSIAPTFWILAGATTSTAASSSTASAASTTATATATGKAALDRVYHAAEGIAYRA